LNYVTQPTSNNQQLTATKINFAIDWVRVVLCWCVCLLCNITDIAPNHLHGFVSNF
jgi:REP element-mobilizing transposase RayT